MNVSVNLGTQSYSIVVEAGALGSVGERLRALVGGRRAALVTDAGIRRLHGETGRRQPGGGGLHRDGDRGP